MAELLTLRDRKTAGDAERVAIDSDSALERILSVMSHPDSFIMQELNDEEYQVEVAKVTSSQEMHEAIRVRKKGAPVQDTVA